jgi:translation initiation factor IF-2
MSDTKDTVKDVPQVEVPATAPAEAAAPQAGADLSVQDLQGLKTIIDVASSRGAFKPNEMMSVGQVYGKLETFLSAVQQQGSTTDPAQGV